MLSFKHIRLKNFLSVGNAEMQLQLDDGFCLLTGANGAGKSTIIEAINFALFGKTIRDINKAEIVNNKNKKGCVVELHLSNNNDDIVITRSIKPDDIRLEVNGEVIDAGAHAKETQAEIERVLGIEQHIFQSTVALSKTGNVDFLNLSTPKRRKLIDSICNVEKITEKLAEAKETSKKITTAIEKVSQSIDKNDSVIKTLIEYRDNEVENANNLNISNENKVNELKSIIDKIKKDIENIDIDIVSEINDITLKIDENNSKLVKINDVNQDKLESELSDKQTEYDNEIKVYNKSHKEFTTASNKLINAKEVITNKISTIESNINEMKNSGNCYTCGQSLSTATNKPLSDLEKELHELNTKLESVDLAITDLTKTENKLSVKKSQCDYIAQEVKTLSDSITAIKNNIISNATIKDNINVLNNKINEINSSREKKLSEYNHRIDKLNDEIKSLSIPVVANVDKHNADIENHETANKDLRDKLDALSDKKKIVDKALFILSDNGFKAFIVNRFMQAFNIELSNYVNKLGLDVSIEVDSQLNETIKLRGRESISYNGLSEGQRLRINLSVVMAFRKVSLLNSGLSSNLLILDEVFDASLDKEGSEAFIRLLIDENTNTIVISHTPDKIASNFEWVYEIYDDSGFTNMRET